MALETAASNELIFGLTGPQILVGAAIGALVYYGAKRVGRVLSGQEANYATAA